VTSPNAVYTAGDTVLGVFVVYGATDLPITGLIQSDFSSFLSKDGVDSAEPVSIVEVGDGRYGYSFGAVDGGEWYLVVRSGSYNARGWQDSVEVQVVVTIGSGGGYKGGGARKRELEHKYYLPQNWRESVLLAENNERAKLLLVAITEADDDN
jgi:hypothetical protein